MFQVAKGTHSGSDIMERHCNSCGKNVKVKPVALIGQTINGECVYEAVCSEKGHPFSPTLLGFSVIVSQNPLKV